MGFFLIILFMLPRSSAAERAAGRGDAASSRRRKNAGAQHWHSGVDVDWLAKPFTLFRSLFSSEPDPDLVRRLMLAGYRKPAHVDIFLGARLVLPAAPGISGRDSGQQQHLFLFLLTVVLAFFIPDFWLNLAVKKRRERIRLSLPDGLDLLAICMEAGSGPGSGYRAGGPGTSREPP